MNKEFKLTKKNQTLTIMPFSDIHYGNSNCNIEFFEFMLDKFKHIKGNKLAILLGDECDVATKRQGNSTYEQKIDVNEQIEYITKSFEPFSKDILGMVRSNHMDRVKKEFDLDISKVIADNLNIQYSNNLYEELKINNSPYTIYATHGTKTSGSQHLMEGAVQRQTQHIMANLFLYGHAHYGHSWSVPQVNSDGYYRRHYVLCGHMLNYKGSYAEVMGLKPNPPCFAKISVNPNLRTNVEIYNSDEWCKL